MKWTLLLILYFCSSCLPLPEESDPTSSSLFVSPGDILVSSVTLDTVFVLDSEGIYKRILWRTTRTTEVINGLGWMHSTNEILIAVDGTPDRIVAVSVVDGRERVIINDTNLNGTVRGVTQLYNSRDIISSKGTSLERFNEYSIRQTFAGVWPSSAIANSTSILALENGNWISTSLANGVRLFPDSVSAFTPVAQATAPANTAASYGVAQTSNGGFVVSWEGSTADYLSLYNSDLSFNRHIIDNNQGLLIAPRGVAVKPNGNFLVADQTRQYIVEVTPSGQVIKLIGQGFLNTPYALLIVPNFSP
jgi:hypothetical protein